MAEDWSQKEVKLITEDYFDMLKQELLYLKYNKTEHRRALQPKLKDRTDGSIEFKHQNISAVLREMELPFIKGYKPRYNYQDLLIRSISLYVQRHHAELNKIFEKFADEAASDSPVLEIDYATALDTPPERSEVKTRIPRSKAVKTDFLQKEQRNRKLGESGERFVMGWEKWRLKAAGHPKLADKVSWDSKEKGDGLGYDILSKNEDGSNRYIEVKTTKLAKESPFYVSANEIAFAEQNPDSHFLYRVFDAANHKKLFIQQGPYAKFCRLGTGDISRGILDHRTAIILKIGIQNFCDTPVVANELSCFSLIPHAINWPMPHQ